jgi:hypothetical protein
MDIGQISRADKPAPISREWRNAVITAAQAQLVARLHALRRETFIARCQLDNPRNECRRELLATRLDATDTRAADITARLLETRL